MATTDARAGFRLPWSSDRSSTDEGEQVETAEATADATADAAAEPTTETTDHAATGDWPGSGAESQGEAQPTEPTEAPAADDPQPLVAESESMPEIATTTRTASGRKPSKFLADLTKAMQTAAEEARSLALSQLQADAKSHIEQIHARSSTDNANLRRTADDDVAAVREWSKAEIARIREETEAKISDRKRRLESEIEHHAAVIEREIEAVQSTVAGFEADMATFFERLLAEEDPTQFATMAENLPEPPSFESVEVTAIDETTVLDAPEALNDDAVSEPEFATETEGSEATDAAEMTEVEAEAQAEAETLTQAETQTDVEAQTEAETHTEADPGQAWSPDMLIGDSPNGSFGTYEGAEGEDGEVDREAAFAAIQAAAEAAASAEVAADAAARAEAVADVAIEIIGSHGEDGEGEGAEEDPRVAALGLSPDYDPAAAEALANANPADGEEIPEIGDDALAARLAGLVPNRGAKAGSGDATSTHVIVVGLVSVASIASFKRHLGRVPGVQSVGVSSGPDGEFVFAVNHTADVVLREAIPSLPSFQARVTGTSDGVVNVAAHDPESDN